jgi:hypothetical protein
MNKNLSNIADELFGKIRTQFPKVKLRDEDRESTDEPELARFFNFDYHHNRVPLGAIDISISEKDGLVIIYSNDIVEEKDEFVKNKFYNFLQELREFAKQRLMNFDTRDISKSNLEKRDYEFMAKKNNGEDTMSESKLYGTSKTSYQQLGDAKLIVKHSAPVNFENPAGRAQRIESIYIENAQGERFKYPYKHLNGARALATHVAHGGTPYDSIGGHVIGLSEELSNLRMFKQYVSRNPMVSEAMGSIHSKVMERIDAVKKEIHSLQNATRYTEFAENFHASDAKEIPEDIMNDWIDRLTIRTFNEELKNVFPYIFKLVDESDIPVKDVNPNDMLSELSKDTLKSYKGKAEKDADEYEKAGHAYDSDPDERDFAPSAFKKAEQRRAGAKKADEKSSKKESYSPEDQFENFIDRIVSERVDIFSDDEDSKREAVDKLNQLVSQPIPVGTDGSNAVESLSEIIDDDELTDVFKELADIDPEHDVRDILKDYIKIKDEENGTDILTQIQFPADDGMDAAPAAPAEPAPAPEPAPAEPAPAEPAPAAPQPVAEEKEDPPFDGPYKKSGDNKDQFGNSVKTKNMAKHLAKKGMADAIKKAKKAGATAETIIRIAGKEMTLGEAITKAGMKVEDVFGNKADELIEFVKSMYNANEGNFPKGEEGVKIACEKKFGDSAGPIAEKVIAKLSSLGEMARMKKMAGMGEGYYDLDQGNVPGMEPIDFSSKPSFKELITRYTQLVYQGHAGTTSDEEEQEYNDIVQYVADRFGEKGSAHLQKAGEVSYWGRDDKPYGRDSRSSNLGRPNQPSGDFRTTKSGKMHGQDAKIMKGKVSDRLGKHPEPNLPESSELAAMLKIAGLR